MLSHFPQIALYAFTWIVAGTFLKRFAQTGEPTHFAFSIAASVIGAAIAVPLLKAQGLGVTMALTSVLYLIVMVIVGLFYGERVNAFQIAGVVLACLSIILMSVSVDAH